MQISLDVSWWQFALLVVDYAIKLIMIGVVPGNRKPSSANAWLLLILFLPLLGLPLYLLFGSKFISRRRHRIQHQARAAVANIHAGVDSVDLPFEKAQIVTLNETLTGYPAVPGAAPALWTDYDMTMERIAFLIDAARHTVNIEIYAVAWDATTAPVFEAIERAVARGVHVRLLFDHIGSQKYPGFRQLKKRLTEIGVDWHLMLPLDPLRRRWRRPDLRNHRKLVVVDNAVAMVGSFNLIDRSYLMPGHVRAGRQWVDAFVELTGPIVASVESMFAVDWFTESGEVVELITPGQLALPAAPAAGSAAADAGSAAADATNVLQLVPSGPGFTTEPNLRMFNALANYATEHLILCSPYFVPEDSLLESITSACYRGVRVDLLVGEKADQFMVQHAQSAYYQQLLEAGVHIHEFPAPYVLHTKFALADPGPTPGAAATPGAGPTPGAAATPGAASRTIGVIGSSNMDIRSFSLNYESSLFVAEGSLLPALHELALNYLAVSRELLPEVWAQRPWTRRYIDNVMKLTSAVQ